MSETAKVVVRPLKMARVLVTIEGSGFLLTNRIPEEALSLGTAPADSTADKKKKLTPDETFERSRYMIDSKTHGFPAQAIKSAMIGAIRYIPDNTGKSKLTMVAAKALFHVLSEKHPSLLPIKYKKCERATHFGRNQNAGGALVEIHRAQYSSWSIDVPIEFNEGMLSAQAVINLLTLAGTIGIGAFRPEKGGTFGQFIVKESKGKRKKVA